MAEVGDWRPIETAPHGEDVILGWWVPDVYGNPLEWKMEIGPASWGWSTESVSNMSYHGCATHWMLKPLPPSK